MLKEFEGFRKGIDLGGWLSQCDHTKERYEKFIVEEDIETISKWGADHVRVPVDYELVEDTDGNYREEGFAYIDRAVNWCGKYGLNMVLDLHKTFGFSFDYGENESGFFDNEDYQERFYRLWEEFAKRYAKYEDRLVFELLNEVTDQSYSDKWNEISGKCIERIRAIAPTVKILVGGYWNNSVDAVKDLAMPADENIVYNFHNYDPMIFTHQGAHWVKDLPADLRISMDMTLGEMEKVVKEKAPALIDQFHIPTSPDRYIDADYFKERLKEAVKIAEERNVILYCGEYGVIDVADVEDKLKWYKAINEAFEYYGIGRATWSYRSMNFGLTDSRLDSVREELLKYI